MYRVSARLTIILVCACVNTDGGTVLKRIVLPCRCAGGGGGLPLEQGYRVSGVSIQFGSI